MAENSIKKQVIGFILLVVFLLSLIGFLIYITKAVHITFKNDNIYRVELNVPGTNGLYTNNKDKVNRVIKYLNSIVYFKGEDIKVYNESPDVGIYLFDKKEKVIDRIQFYGLTVAIHKKNRYHVSPFLYRNLEKLCNDLQ